MLVNGLLETGKPSCCMTRKIDFIPRNVDPVPLTGKEIVNYSLSFIQCVSS